MRWPSIKTSVSLGSKPRGEMDDAPGVLPAPLFEVGTPLGPATVVFLINSSAVRSPDFSIKSRLIVKTGFGPTSSAVGMFDPVTMTRSTSAWAAEPPEVASARSTGGGDGFCAKALD